MLRHCGGQSKTAAFDDLLSNDGLVPLSSALGEHADPEYDLKITVERKRVRRGIGYFDLLSDLAVYAWLKEWVSE